MIFENIPSKRKIVGEYNPIYYNKQPNRFQIGIIIKSAGTVTRPSLEHVRVMEPRVYTPNRPLAREESEVGVRDDKPYKIRPPNQSPFHHCITEGALVAGGQEGRGDDLNAP